MVPAAASARPVAINAARTTLTDRRIIRPRITANFRPMSRFLTGQRSLATTSEEREQKKLALNQSLASQILADTQGKLFSMGLGEGGAFGEEKRGQPRTFAEEEALAVKRSAPRVRMNRVLGKGQTGGGRLLVSAPGPDEKATKRTDEAATNVVPPPRFANANGYVDASSSGSGVKRKASDGSSLSGVLRTPVTATGAATPASKKAVSFQSPTWAATQYQVEDKSHFEDEAKSVGEEPFVCNPMSEMDSMKPLDPICQDVPKTLMEAIIQKTATPEWKSKAHSYEYGLGDPDMLTPTPAKKKPRSGTPHFKKTNTVATSTASTNGNQSNKVAPFSFMPGGPSASFSSPSAYKYKDVASDHSKPATETKTPSKSAIKSLQKESSSSNTVDSTTASSASGDLKTTTPSTCSGWGNLFPPPTPGEWKCTSCYVKNAKDAKKCVSCNAERTSDDDGPKKSDATSALTDVHSSASSKGDGKDKASAAGDIKASIGSSGFSFGSSIPSSSGGAIGSTGFSFGAPSASSSSINDAGFKFVSSKEYPSTPAKSAGFAINKSSSDVPNSASSSIGFNFGTTSAFDTKSEEKKDDGKEALAQPAAPVGFSFGTNSTTPFVSNSEKETTAKPGFSFGVGTDASKDGNAAPTLTFGSTTLAPELKNYMEDNKAPSLPFGSSAPTPAQNESSNTSGTLFSFGGNSNATKTEPFVFGSKAPSVAEKKTSAVSGSTFTFGQASTAAKDESKVASFSFGATTPAATEKKDSTSGFSFGISQGGTHTPAPSNPSDTSNFSFGASTPAPAPAANVVFAFGTQASTASMAPPSSTSGVSFGGTTSTSAPSSNLFTFGGGAAPTNFGASTSSIAPGATSTYSFGAASTQPAATSFTPVAAPFAPAAAPFTPAASGFTFGAPPTTPATGSFGMPPSNNLPASTPGFGFGSTSGTTPASTSFGGGGFGISTPSATTPGGFSIGTADSKKSAGRRILKVRRPPK